MSGKAAGIIIAIAGAILGVYMVIQLQMYFKDLVTLVLAGILAPWLLLLTSLIITLLIFTPPTILEVSYDIILFIALGIGVLGAIIAALD